ncbi:MAG TPA: MFS transporter [Micropruina sp.]|nr:MFS transporter [Micropruina sp.]
MTTPTARSATPAAGVSTLQRTFVVASASLVAVFAASASPVPLFNLYRAENGVSTADLSLSVVAYFAGTILALLCLGRIANHVGRRPAALATLLVMVAGCLVLLNVTGLGTLLAGRFLMGIGAGLASSALTSYIVDAAPSRPDWLAPVVTSQAPMVGLTVGSVVAGAMVQYLPGARYWVYLVMGLLLIGCLLMMLGSRETGTPSPGVWRSLRPRVAVPARVRPLLPVALSVFAATWALGAFYQSFVPTIAADQLHSDNALVVSLLFAAYMAPSVLGAPLVGRLLPAFAQRLGMITFLIGVTGILIALTTVSLWLMVLSTIVASLGQGMAVSASMRALLHGADLAERPPLMAAIYLACYSGAMVPSIIAGQLSHVLPTVTIAFGYGALALIATVVTFIFARNPSGA